VNPAKQGLNGGPPPEKEKQWLNGGLSRR